MKEKILKIASFILVFGSMMFLYTSCYEPQEGCLNPIATNYNVHADDACDECCTLPNLILQVMHRYQGVDTFSVSPGDTLLDDFGQAYFLNQFEYFINEVSLTGMDGEMALLDSVQISENGFVQTIVDDIRLIRLGRTSYTIGSFDELKTYDQLTFKLGLGFDQLDFDFFSEDYLLREFQDSLYIGDKFVSIQTDVVLDTMSQVNTTLNVLDQQFDIVLTGMFEPSLGSDLRINVEVDLKKWFEGISVLNDSETEIIAKLSANATNAFSL